MTDFSQQIANFTSYGTYNYALDSVGNEILNPSSSTFEQNYFSLPLSNYDYNDAKIVSFYDVEFTEFIPSSDLSSSVTASLPQSAIDQINAITFQNTQLQNQLNILVANNAMNSGSADAVSIKNTIIGLRILLGQGSTNNDFQSVYPYAPISFTLQNPPSSS